MKPIDMPPLHELSAMSFSYGNLMCSTRHRPRRAAFAVVAERRGWTKEQFDAWARDRVWAD